MRGRNPEWRIAAVVAALSLVATTGAGAATITVNSAADDTTGGDALVTLREAVIAANGDGPTDLGDAGSGPDTIVFDAALAGMTIELSAVGDTTFGPSALTVSSEITIDGGAAPFLTISRDGALERLRLFYVSPAGSLTLRDVTLANGLAKGYDGGYSGRGGTGGGSAGFGGAVIVDEGSLTIDSSTLADNQAVGGVGGPEDDIPDTSPRGGSGGAGLAGDGGPPTGQDPIFDTGGAGGPPDGGDGGNGGDASTDGSPGGFGSGGGGGGGNANSPAADGGPGGFGGGGGGGGGGQTGQPAGSGASGGFGGGAGGNGTSSGSITAAGGGGGGGAGMGGAVFNNGGTVDVTNSTFSANGAVGGAGGRNGSAGQGLGGAIFNYNGHLTVLAATFEGNGAAQGGGGIYNLGNEGDGNLGEETATAQIDGTILANSTNTDLVSASINSGTEIAFGTDNLIESETGFSGSTASTADPQLAALADNGGATETHLPADASPAVDASTLGGPAIDQRGETRPQGADRDIGSVELVSNQPPEARCQDVVVEADAVCQGTATASDVDDGSSDPDGDPITFDLSPAGPYPLGETMVTLTVTDDGDLSDSCEAKITVIDVTPPVITCPADAVLECPADTSPAVTGTATAVDNCTAEPAIGFADVSVPGCGGTEIITRTWTATDEAGLSDSCDQVIETIDTAPPVVVPGPDNAVCLWPPNHKFVFIPGVTSGVQVVDACDPAPLVAAIECRSDQCDDAPCPEHPGENGDGKTTGDCAYDGDTDTLALRSERAGTDPDGRRYFLDLTAVDGCGNSSGPVVVFSGYVPHDQNPREKGCLKP